MMLTPEDKQLLEIVQSDFRFLRDEWDNQVDDHSLRRSSPILRRFLVENDLHRAWKIVGMPNQPRRLGRGDETQHPPVWDTLRLGFTFLQPDRLLRGPQMR
jgi:hypothetical protein